MNGETMELIDTHCHIDIKAFASDFETIYEKAWNAGVKEMVLPGVDRDGWDRIVELSKKIVGLYAAPGLHPMYLALHRPHHLEELEELTRKERLTAIGEIGLDYHIENCDRAAQQVLFEHQLKIARNAHLPILLHVRKAHDQVLATLRSKRFPHGGIVHAFNGSHQQAIQFIKLGFAISICGTLTYDRAKKIRAIAAELPQQDIVLETDAPDIPLAGRRGMANLPEFLPEILEVLSRLRNESPVETARYTTANAKRLLGLPL
jgi:TatD DNase family protein